MDPVAEELVDEAEAKAPAAEDHVEQLAEGGLQVEVAKEEEEDLEQQEEEEEVGEAVRFGEVSDAVLEILEGSGEVDVEKEVGLTDREKAALEVLEQVVAGAGSDERSIDADARLEMLNVSIAVLQPALAAGIDPALLTLREKYNAIVEDLTELREFLEKLAEAQELESEEEEDKAEGQDDKPDDDKPDQPTSDTAHTTFWQKVSRKFSKKRPDATPPPDPGAKPDAELGIPARESTLFGKPGEPAVEPEPRGPSTAWDDDPRAR